MELPLSLPSSLLIVFTIYISYLIAEAIYNLYFHPLARFPGPRLAAVTQFYGYYYDMYLDGQFTPHIFELHKQYGPIVRIEPNEVHISDSTFYHTIYNFDPELEKSPRHLQNLQHSVTTETHRMRRKAFDPFFSRASIQRLEPLIKEVVNKLCTRLEEARDAGKTVDMSFWYRCMTFEIICDFLLSQPYNLMEDPESSAKMIKSIVQVFKVLKYVQHIKPIWWVVHNLEKLPSWAQMSPSDPGLMLVKVWSDGLGPRMKNVRENKVEEKANGHIVVMQEYLKNENLPAREKSYENVKESVQMFMGAGMETTGYALSMGTYQLVTKPETMRRLKEEIATVWPSDPEELPSWSTLEKLPYLTAVLKESIRLGVGVASRLIRVNRKRAIQYKDWEIPPGCHISMNQWFVLWDPEIFHEPKKFNPERWLQGERSKELDKWFVAFSRGSRNCIGERLAWSEMYITLAAVIHRFDMSLHETEDVDVYPVYDHFVPFPEREDGVRVTITK